MCFLGRLDKCGSVANRDTASRWWFARGFPQLRPPRLLSRRRCRVPRAAPALACPSPNRPEVVGVLGFYTTRLRFPRSSGRCSACVRLVLARPRTRSGAYSSAAASPFDVGWRDSNPRLFVPNNGNQRVCGQRRCWKCLKPQLITLKLLTPKGASMKYCGLSADCGGCIYSPMPSGPIPIRPVPVTTE